MLPHYKNLLTVRCSTYICVCSLQTMWSSSWRIWLSGTAATARTTTSPTTIVWRPMRIQIKSSPRAKEIGPRYRGLASKNYNLERVEPFHTCSLSYVKEHLLHGVMCEREHGLIFREISTSISRLKNKYHSRENTVQLFWWKKLLHGENQQTILVTVCERGQSPSLGALTFLPPLSNRAWTLTSPTAPSLCKNTWRWRTRSLPLKLRSSTSWKPTATWATSWGWCRKRYPPRCNNKVTNTGGPDRGGATVVSSGITLRCGCPAGGS